MLIKPFIQRHNFLVLLEKILTLKGKGNIEIVKELSLFFIDEVLQILSQTIFFSRFFKILIVNF